MHFIPKGALFSLFRWFSGFELLIVILPFRYASPALVLEGHHLHSFSSYPLLSCLYQNSGLSLSLSHVGPAILSNVTALVSNFGNPKIVVPSQYGRHIHQYSSQCYPS